MPLLCLPDAMPVNDDDDDDVAISVFPKKLMQAYVLTPVVYG